MEVSHNHSAKSQLAKLLATENITVQHKPDAKTAWFDVKNRVLSLPVWREMSNDLYDLLVVHEVGHALDTPPDGLEDIIKGIAHRVANSTSMKAFMAVKGFLNVIEDARIDKRQKRRFPGARRNYVQGYKELIDRDFFGTLTKDVNTMSFIDRLNIYCKGGSMLGIKFNAEEKSWLAKVEAAETFDEVVALTEEIYRWSKEKQEQEKSEANDQRMKSKNGSGDPEESDEYEFSDEEGDSDADEDEDGQPSRSKSPYDDDEDEDEDEDFDGANGDEGDGEGDDEKSEKDDDPIAGGSPEDELPEAETEKAWQEKIQSLIENSEYEYVYAKFPKLASYNDTVVDYKQVLAEQRADLASYHSKDYQNIVRANLQKFKAEENATISFMVKEFEMRKAADEHTRTSIAKTGVIDTNKLHSYKYNDDLFRRITTVATGKSHGFVMFLDWSGSMDHHLKKTVQQLLSLVMFCRRVQVPFEVYTFRSANYTDKYQGPSFTNNPNELDLQNFAARNILSSRMSAQEMNDAMFNVFYMAHSRLECDPLSATPLNQAIIAAPEIVNRFKAKSKVQIVNTIFLTDGESDPIYGVCGRNLYHRTKPEKFILQDDYTKKSYDIPTGKSRFSYNSNFSNQYLTPIFFKRLKDQTGCNLIGFYITNDGFDSTYRNFNAKNFGDHYTAAQKSWKENGFFGVTNVGYDEYYILNPRTFGVSSGNLKVDADAGKRKIATAFIKFSEKKTVSRILLSKVVKRIAA
jgi:hypothetical protein